MEPTFACKGVISLSLFYMQSNLLSIARREKSPAQSAAHLALLASTEMCVVRREQRLQRLASLTRANRAEARCWGT